MRFGIVILLVAVWTVQADPPAKFQMSKEEKELLDLTNQERKKNNVPPLKPNPTLFKVARAHSANMARKKQMNHVLDGKTPRDRMEAAGYKASFGGENIGCGSPGWGPARMMKAWMESPRHRDNILSKNYKEIGIGIAKDDQGQVYYTQVFASPKPESGK